MNLTFVAISTLSVMIFVLAGMVGYLYFQQTELKNHVSILHNALLTHISATVTPEDEVEDDRIKVNTEVEHNVEKVGVESVEKDAVKTVEKEGVEEVEDEDVDDLNLKSTVQLRKMLTEKGIPFGKRDSKTVLVQLLKTLE